MPAWLHPGLLVTVTTPNGERYIWFDDRFACARRLDHETQARVMRLQRARFLATLGLAGVFFGALVVALLTADTPAAEVNPILYLAGFMLTAAGLSAVFARAQRRHVDRQPPLALPPEAVARLQAARASKIFGFKRQQDVACTVAAELVYRNR